jgi:hypothetical protein
MVIGPASKAEAPVKLFWKSILSVVVAMLLFEGMVTAFHLLNLASTLAVVAGLCLLLLLAAGGVVAFRFIWRRL